MNDTGPSWAFHATGLKDITEREVDGGVLVHDRDHSGRQSEVQLSSLFPIQHCCDVLVAVERVLQRWLGVLSHMVLRSS